MKSLTLLLFFILLISCSNNNSNVSSKNDEIAAVEIDGELYAVDEDASRALEKDEKDKVFCEKRRVTGSHFTSKRCTTYAKREEERRMQKEKLRRMRESQERVIDTTVGDN